MKYRRVRVGQSQSPRIVECEVYDVIVPPDTWSYLIDAIRDSFISELPKGFVRVERGTGDIIIRIAGFKED